MSGQTELANELAAALAILHSWKADAEEYPSWAWQYRERVYRAIDSLDRVLIDLQRERVVEGREP